MTANFPTGVHMLEEIRLFSCFKIGQIQLRKKQLYLLQENSVFWEVSGFFSRKASVVTIFGDGVVSVNSAWQSNYPM